MPIYAYQCTSCGHELEALQKIGEAPLADCPECGRSALTKKVTAAAFRLKGSGWYETDFKNKDKKTAAKKTDGDAKSDGGDKAKEAPKGTDTKSAGGSTGGGKASTSGGD